MYFGRGFTRWGASLEGESISLDNVSGKLNKLFLHKNDLFVTRYGTEYIIRSSAWDQVSSSSELLTLAENAVQIINGCLRFTDGVPPIRVGTVFEFHRNGDVKKQERITNTVIWVHRAEGNWISPEQFKDILSACDSNKHVSDAITAFGLANDWFHLYICLESLELYAGGERELLDRMFVNDTILKKVKRTANSFRHASGRFKPIRSPIEIDEARRVLAEVINKVVSEVAALQSRSP